MKKWMEKSGKYSLATYMIMIVGAILFILTPLFIKLLHIDTDLLGILVFLIGLIMFVVGLIVRSILKKA